MGLHCCCTTGEGGDVHNFSDELVLNGYVAFSFRTTSTFLLYADFTHIDRAHSDAEKLNAKAEVGRVRRFAPYFVLVSLWIMLFLRRIFLRPL